MGQDAYLVSRQAASGFSGLGTLNTDALQEASAYCNAHSKELQIISATESKPPYIVGNFPRAEVQFRCVARAESQSQP
jgi:hypothetical protein